MKESVTNNWNADLYDGNHSFVSTLGNDVIELLAPQKGERILDIGCGTGDLANRLYEYGVDLIGIDQSETMIEQALSKYPHITFLVEDILKLKYTSEFNAVFSNATLHWVKQPEQALNRIFAKLKRGGRFVAEFGGKDNVQSITNEIINQLKKEGVDYKQEQFPWYFPSIGQYTSLMEKAGFRVTFAHHFDRPTPLQGENGLRNWIEMFAGMLFKNLTTDKIDQIINNVEHNLRAMLYIDNQWFADYKRIRVVGVKE